MGTILAAEAGASSAPPALDAPRGYANVFPLCHIALACCYRGADQISRRWRIASPPGESPARKFLIVISNREGAPGLALAAARGIASKAIPSKGLAREDYDRLVVEELRKAGVEIVCLAGFMRLLSPYFVAAFPQRILEYSPVASAVVSRARSAAAGAGIRREIQRMHRASGG